MFSKVLVAWGGASGPRTSRKGFTEGRGMSRAPETDQMCAGGGGGMLKEGESEQEMPRR